MSKTVKLVFGLLVIVGLVLSACGATPTPTPAPTPTPVVVTKVETKVVEKQVTQVVEKVVTATPVPPPPPTATPVPKKVKKSLEFTLVTTDRKDRQQKAQIIQAQLRAQKFGVNLQFLYGRGLFATCTAGGPLNCRTFDAAIYTWLSGEDPDPSSLYTCKSIPSKENNYSGQNYPGFCDKKFDELVTKAAFDVQYALSREKRRPLYVEAQKIWSDAVPVIPLESNVAVFAAVPALKNFKPTPTQSPETWNAWEWELPGKDTIIISMQQEPDTLHPDVGSMMARTIVLGPVFPGMAASNDKAEWIPMGLVSLPTIDNGGAKLVGTGADQYLEVTCKIKPGLKWHDGTPVTSADAVYRWKLYMDEKFEAADRTGFEKFYEVAAPAPDTFVIKYLSEKQAKAAAAGTLTGAVNFKAYKDDYGPEGLNLGEQVGPVVDPLYFTCMDVLPSHILSKVKAEDQAKADFAKKPIGYGPYKVKDWKPAQQIELEAVEGNILGTPKIKNIIIKIIPDSNAIIAALQKGELDAATQIGLEVSQAPELDKLEAAGKYKVHYIQGYFWEHIDLNTTKFPLNDVKVRKAMAHSINKKAYLDTLYYGKQPAGDSWIPKFNWAYGGDQIVRYDFDAAKAQALLKEAGWDCSTNPCTKEVLE